LREHPTTTVVAILGANMVVETALAQLLEGKGYSIKLIETSSLEEMVEEQLGGVDVVLLAPSLTTEACDAFLDALRRSTSQKRTAPTSLPPLRVITLCSPSTEQEEQEEAPLQEEDEQVLRIRKVPWPTIRFERVVEEIEAALEEVLLPPGFSLDRSDADVLILWDASGSVVSRFSPLGAARRDIERAAWEDYKKKQQEEKDSRSA
jgi:hypothetical protein